MIALAAQKVIVIAKDTLDPALAARIVMEAIIPLASVDPDVATVQPAAFIDSSILDEIIAAGPEWAQPR